MSDVIDTKSPYGILGDIEDINKELTIPDYYYDMINIDDCNCRICKSYRKRQTSVKKIKKVV